MFRTRLFSMGLLRGGNTETQEAGASIDPKKKGPRLGLLEGKLIELLGSEDHPTQKSQKVVGPTFWDFLKVNFGSSFANGGEPCNDNHGGFQRPHYIFVSWSRSRSKIWLPSTRWAPDAVINGVITPINGLING